MRSRPNLTSHPPPARRKRRKAKPVTEEGNSEEGEEAETTEESEAGHSESEETLLGIETESPLAVGAGVLLSVVLAALAFKSTNRVVLSVVGLFALAFAVLDSRELLHQLDESRAGLAALAGLIALLHLGAAVVAAREARAITE